MNYELKKQFSDLSDAIGVSKAIVMLKEQGHTHDSLIEFLEDLAYYNVGLVYLIIIEHFSESKIFWKEHLKWGFFIDKFISGESDPMNFIAQKFII